MRKPAWIAQIVLAIVLQLLAFVRADQSRLFQNTSNPVCGCATVLFIHVEKTGGTSVRHALEQLGPIYSGPNFSRDVYSNLQQSTDYIYSNPFITVEIHGRSRDAYQAFLQLKKLKSEDTAFRQLGCRVATVMFMRDPRDYYYSAFRGSLLHTDFFTTNFIRSKFSKAFSNETVRFEVELRERIHIYETYPDRYLLGLKATREYFVNWLSKLEAKYAGGIMYDPKKTLEYKNDQVLLEPMKEEYKKAIIKNYKENIDVLGITSRHGESLLKLAFAANLRRVHLLYANDHTEAYVKAKGTDEKRIAQEDEFIEGVIQDSKYDKIIYEHSKIVFGQQNQKYAQLLKKYTPSDEGNDHFIEIDCADYKLYE